MARTTTTQLLLLTATTTLLFLLTATRADDASHGSPCDHQTNHCNKSTGLICHEGFCACGNGSLTTIGDSIEKLNYARTWDNTLQECVGLLDSVCIGVGRKLPNHEGPWLRCAPPLGCFQIEGLPIGQGICKIGVPQTDGYGGECSQDKHCDKAAGLVCHETEKKCVCGGGKLTDDHSFVLNYDASRGTCFAVAGSACIKAGNAAGVKKVECLRGNCIQLANMPPGVGVCERIADDEDENDTTTSTTTERDEDNTASTSTEGDGDGGDEEDPTTTPSGSGRIALNCILFLSMVVIAVGLY